MQNISKSNEAPKWNLKEYQPIVGISYSWNL